MINNILVGLMAVQTVCVCIVVYKANKTNNQVIWKMHEAIAEIRMARGEVITSATKLDKTKDEVIKEFANQLRKRAFDLAFYGIRMK